MWLSLSFRKTFCEVPGYKSPSQSTWLLQHALTVSGAEAIVVGPRGWRWAMAV